MYAGDTPPGGWLLCNGAAVSRTTYANLFTAIGTKWGVGDNSTTFNLPDMREASPYGVGTFSAVTGTTHGSITEHDALALGAFADDREQAHWHNVTDSATNTALTWGQPASDNSGFVESATKHGGGSVRRFIAGASITDGSNGTPRVGNTTRGKLS